jgi:GTP:adenosylcobinamide-phosphate guanylyltransferase
VVDAVVLAGRANDGKLASIGPQANEALVEVVGKPMLCYVVEGLLGARRVNRVIIAGPRAVLAPALGTLADRVDFVEPAGDIIDNLQAALECLGSPDMVLVATSDIPLITPEVVDGFVSECSARRADLHYPVISRELLDRAYPGMRRTYGRLKDGTFTGGNLVLVNPQVLRTRAQLARSLFAARKQPLRLAAVLGPAFILRLVFVRLTLLQLEAVACRLLGLAGAHAVRTGFPEIGVDIDKPDDHAMVSRLLRSRGG